MRERYATLNTGATVFRTVVVGGGHLPEGHVLPLGAWLIPDGADKAEAERTGRLPGISVWDQAITSPTQAWEHRGVSPVAGSHLAFSIRVDQLGNIAATHQREVVVVADPIDPVPPEWHDGHSLVEGMQRPQNCTKLAQATFLDAAIQSFSKM